MKKLAIALIIFGTLNALALAATAYAWTFCGWSTSNTVFPVGILAFLGILSGSFLYQTNKV